MDKMTKEYFVWSMAKAIAPNFMLTTSDTPELKKIAENVMQAANAMVDAWQNMFGVVLPRHNKSTTFAHNWEVADNFGEHLIRQGYDKATDKLIASLVLRRDFLPENFKECEDFLLQSPIVAPNTLTTSTEQPHRLNFAFATGADALDANRVIEWLGDKPYTLDIEVDIMAPNPAPAVYGGVAYGVTVGEEEELD